MHNIESDHFPEITKNNGGLRRIEKLKIRENLSSPENRTDFFHSLTDEQYKKMIGYINSITRGKKIEYEYEDGQVPMGATPELESKEPLMNSLFETTRKILEQKIEDKEKLRTAALTVAGAINYIHPYLDGNGRSARVLHYLIEFGTDRGEEIFEKELYAIIAKIPLCKKDSAQVIYDTPPPELEPALSKYCFENIPNYQNLDKRAKAGERLKIFLKMMQGDIKILVPIKTPLNKKLYEGDEWKTKIFNENEIDGKTLYFESYLSYSTAPNRDEIKDEFNEGNKNNEESDTKHIKLNIDEIS